MELKSQEALDYCSTRRFSHCCEPSSIANARQFMVGDVETGAYNTRPARWMPPIETPERSD